MLLGIIVVSGEHSRAFACYASELWHLGSVNAWILLKWGFLKNALYLSVNVFSTKVLIEDTIFTSPSGDGTAILQGHPSHEKVYPFAGQRKHLHFSVSYRKIPKISPGAYIRRGLSMEGNLPFKISWASLTVGSKFTFFTLFYFVFEDNFPSTSPQGLIFGGAI